MGMAAANGPSCLAFLVIKSFGGAGTRLPKAERARWTINVKCLNLSIRKYNRCAAAGELFNR